jgi:hypothetical protein
MKWVWRVGGALVALVVVALIALAVALPRIAGSDAVRTRIQAAARDALGRELSFERLEAGLFPPALRVVAVRVAGEQPKDAPMLEAEELSLRLALLPLLTRTIAVDSLGIESATLRLTRTRDGIQLPEPPEQDAKPAAGGAAADTGEASEPGSSVGLALRGLKLSDSTLILTDRAVSPPVTWELRELDASAKGRLLGDRVDVEADTALASGGKIHVEGSSSLAGELDLDVDLDALALAPLAPYVEGTNALTGSVSGKTHVKGAAADPEQASADLAFSGIELAQGDVRVKGPLQVKAELARPLKAPQGTFSADAEGAEIRYGEAFRKPPGTAARVTGRIVPGQGGALAIDDLAVSLRNLELRGRVAQLSPLRAELASTPFDVDGWEELLPGLAESPPSGRVTVKSLTYSAEPQSLKGRIEIDRLELQRAKSLPLQVRGALVAQGQSVVLEDGALAAGTQSVGLSAKLDDLFGAPRYDVGLEASGADANQVVTALVGKPDTLFGLLGLQARFHGPVGGDLLRSLEGRAGFGVDDGRLAGVSLLRSAFEGLGEAGTLALALGREFGGRDLQRFYGDAFDALRGTFDIRGGVAHTDDLTFAYRGYSVVLRGTLGLADLALDTEGELTIDPALDAEIADQLKLKNYTPTRRTLPLAAVKGTLDAPRVRLSSRAAGALASAYAQPGYAGELKEKAEKALGKEGGEAVEQGLEILDGLLGGKRREKQPEPEQAPAETPAETPEQAPTGSPAAPPESQ